MQLSIRIHQIHGDMTTLSVHLLVTMACLYIVHFAGVVTFTAAENSSSTAAEMCSDRNYGRAVHLSLRRHCCLGILAL